MTAEERALPCSKELFREEVLWLRCIFGLRSPISSPESSIEQQRLSALPTLPGSAVKDVLLIALDVEASFCKPKKEHVDLSKNFQVGFSIFDTRSLLSIFSAPEESYAQQTADALQTYNLCGGSENYCARAARRFLFGESKVSLPDEIRENLNATVAKDRDIVLVVYCGHQDLILLKDIGIDLLPVCIIDIQKASQTVLQLTRRLSLGELVTTLCCPFKYLHVAGNDANFTLRGMLMLVVKDSQQDAALDGRQQVLLSILQVIAQSTMLHSAIWVDKPGQEDYKRAQEARFATTEEERQQKNKEKIANRLARKRYKKCR